MGAIAGSGQHGLGLLCLDTGTAERKREFVPATHGQDGVEQTSGGKNIHGGQTKIGFQGLVSGLGDDFRMTNGVRAVFVHPRVQGGHIHIAYYLTLPSHRMQSHRTRSTPKEGLARFQRWGRSNENRKRWTASSVSTNLSQSYSHISITVYPARSSAMRLESVA